MTSERWHQVKALYHAALERESSERGVFLAGACAGDAELRGEVESLLAQDVSKTGTLDQPAWAGLDSRVPPIAPEIQLGPYKIEGPLGEGGMGAVFRGVDTRLGRSVAVKTSHEQFSARFDREARAISSLNHPHICTLYDVGPNYLVMELCEGETLADRLKRGKLSIQETVRYGAQIADALSAAHAKGMVHRDLKPANVMLTKAGVKVLDFGLAKSLEDETLTASRMVMGTPAYMAPEQREGKECDARTDIYALGLILYEMASGKRRQLDQPVLLNEFPEKFAHVVGRCLERDPEDRWQSARDIQQELQWAETSRNDVLAVAPPQRRKLVPWGVAAALAMALGTVSLLHFREKPPAEQSLRFQIPPPGATQAELLALSPDGHTLAFVASNGGPNRVWIRSLDTLDSRSLTGTDGATYPFWSPDGAYLGFFSQGKLKKIAVGGGLAQTLCDAPNSRGGTWNRGVILFTPDPTGAIFRVPAAGGVPVPVTKVAERGFVSGHRFPAFLPDGVHFFYLLASDRPDTAGLYVGSLDGTAAVRILPDRTNALYAPPGPQGGGGHLLFRRDDTLMALPFDPKTLKVTGEMVPVAEQVWLSNHIGFGAFSVSGNATLVYRSGYLYRNRQLVWMDRAGKRLTTVGKVGGYSDFAISPDEKTAAVQIANGSLSEIWLQDVTQDVISRFTFRPGLNASPVWSPDGRRLVFRFQASGSYNFDIYQKPAGGNGQEEFLLHATVGGAPDDWSSDGKWIVYQQTGQNTAYDLWLLPMDGERKPMPYLQTPFDEVNARFSPDGKWIAYQSNESGQYQVYVQAVPLSGAKWQISTSGGEQPRWRRDGKELFYLSADLKLMAAPIKLGSTVESGSPQALFPVYNPSANSGGMLSGVEPSGDGQRFLVMVSAGGEATTVPPVTVVTNWQTKLKK